jgi:hypothetical protein
MKSILIYILLAILLMWFLTAGGMNLSYDSTHYLVAGDLFSHGKFKQALDKIFPHHAPFYCPIRGMGENPSPLGEDFGMIK